MRAIIIIALLAAAGVAQARFTRGVTSSGVCTLVDNNGNALTDNGGNNLVDKC